MSRRRIGLGDRVAHPHGATVGQRAQPGDRLLLVVPCPFARQKVHGDDRRSEVTDRFDEVDDLRRRERTLPREEFRRIVVFIGNEDEARLRGGLAGRPVGAIEIHQLEAIVAAERHHRGVQAGNQHHHPQAGFEGMAAVEAQHPADEPFVGICHRPRLFVSRAWCSLREHDGVHSASMVLRIEHEERAHEQRVHGVALHTGPARGFLLNGRPRVLRGFESFVNRQDSDSRPDALTCIIGDGYRVETGCEGDGDGNGRCLGRRPSAPVSTAPVWAGPRRSTLQERAARLVTSQVEALRAPGRGRRDHRRSAAARAVDQRPLPLARARTRTEICAAASNSRKEMPRSLARARPAQEGDTNLHTGLPTCRPSATPGRSKTTRSRSSSSPSAR